MMNDRSKESQLLLGLLAILMLVTSVVLFAQQIPPTNLNISKGQTEGSKPQDSFIPSYITRSPITITSNADFTAQGFLGSGIESDPYRIEGYNITTTGTCISIHDTDAYFVIRDCLLTGGIPGHGIGLYRVAHGKTRNNTFSGSHNGLYLYHSDNNMVENNTISGNPLNSGNGVYVYFSSNNNTVVNNTISGYSNGVSIRSSSNNTVVNNTISGNGIFGVDITSSSDNTLVNNTISGNSNGAVCLDSSSNNTLVNNTISEQSSYGVLVDSSSNNTLVNNTISGNTNFGVYLASSSNNILVNNTISGNEIFGVYLHLFSDNNLIYLNVITDNDNENACDYGTGNHWNSTGMGNYWSDYNGTGVYHITGDAGSIDYHPFMYPPDTTPPTIDHPADMDYEEGTTGHSITWTSSDEHPSQYVGYRNGTQVVSESWDGGSIAVNADGLSVGVYNYTIVVYDISGNWVSDTVLVIVQSHATTTSGDVTGLVILFLGVGGIGVVIVVFILMRYRKGSMTGS